MNSQVANSFAKTFLSEALSKQIADCDKYELAQLFLDLFRNSQPVLEAGCGSGRWCGWFTKQGIQCDGIDWSDELCARAQAEIPGSRFFAGDMQQIPIQSNAYGGIIALGSVEHSVHGPVAALKEFYRVLRPGGVAVTTVPYGGRLRRTLRSVGKTHYDLWTNNRLRRILGKQPYTDSSRSMPLPQATREWYPRFNFGKDGWYFYEYEFNKKQMRRFLQETGFEIVREFAAFGNEGILHNFGSRTGRWNPERCDVDFTPLGETLRKTIPVSACGHMLCYVLRKPAV